MVGDADIQVWLDQAASGRPGAVVPYVQSSQARTLQYRLRVVQSAGGGSSQISQGGRVQVAARQPTPLASIVVGTTPGGRCRIELILLEDGRALRSDSFACPR